MGAWGENADMDGREGRGRMSGSELFGNILTTWPGTFNVPFLLPLRLFFILFFMSSVSLLLLSLPPQIVLVSSLGKSNGRAA